MYLPKVYQVRPNEQSPEDQENFHATSMLLRSSSTGSVTSPKSMVPTAVLTGSSSRARGLVLAQNKQTISNENNGGQDECAPEPTRRTGLGRFFRFPKRKSVEQRQQQSQARAQEMIGLYELSETKEMELNKKASIKQPVALSPKLTPTMSLKQAKCQLEAKELQKQQQEAEKPTVDPLSKPHELKIKQRLAERAQRKKAIKERLAWEEARGAPAPAPAILINRRVQSLQPPGSYGQSSPLKQDCLLTRTRSLTSATPGGRDVDDDDYDDDYDEVEGFEVVVTQPKISFAAATLPPDWRSKLFVKKTLSFGGSSGSVTSVSSFDSGSIYGMEKPVGAKYQARITTAIWNDSGLC